MLELSAHKNTPTPFLMLDANRTLSMGSSSIATLRDRSIVFTIGAYCSSERSSTGNPIAAVCTTRPVSDELFAQVKKQIQNTQRHEAQVQTHNHTRAYDVQRNGPNTQRTAGAETAASEGERVEGNGTLLADALQDDGDEEEGDIGQVDVVGDQLRALAIVVLEKTVHDVLPPRTHR